ncbi:MAG: hypothetical protein IKN55_08215 [Oscillospiraceae bacterium]|nr:hypothetical protein [Oscillospiraceae bacterium]
MKHRVAVLLMAMMLVMSGCGGGKETPDSDFRLSGTYKIVSYTEGGHIYSIQSSGLEGVSIHFNEDGTGVLNGTREKTAFTYTEDTITADSGSGEFRLRQKEGRIYVIQTVNGVDHTMVFQ